MLSGVWCLATVRRYLGQRTVPSSSADCAQGRLDHVVVNSSMANSSWQLGAERNGCTEAAACASGLCGFVGASLDESDGRLCCLWDWCVQFASGSLPAGLVRAVRAQPAAPSRRPACPPQPPPPTAAPTQPCQPWPRRRAAQVPPRRPSTSNLCINR